MHFQKSLTTFLLLTMSVTIASALGPDNYWNDIPPVNVKNRIALFNGIHEEAQIGNSPKTTNVKIPSKPHIQDLRAKFEFTTRSTPSEGPVDTTSVIKYAEPLQVKRTFATHMSPLPEEPVDATSVIKYAEPLQVKRTFATHIPPLSGETDTNTKAIDRMTAIESITLEDPLKVQAKNFNNQLDQVLHKAKSIANQLNVPELSQPTSPTKKERIHRHKSKINLEEKMDHLVSLAHKIEFNLNNKPDDQSSPIPSERDQLQKQTIDLLLKRMKNIAIYEDENESENDFHDLPPVVVPTITQEQYAKKINDLQGKLQKTTNAVERGKIATTLFNLNLRLKESQQPETSIVTSPMNKILDLNNVTAALPSKFMAVNQIDDNEDNGAWENDSFGFYE